MSPFHSLRLRSMCLIHPILLSSPSSTAQMSMGHFLRSDAQRPTLSEVYCSYPYDVRCKLPRRSWPKDTHTVQMSSGTCKGRLTVQIFDFPSARICLTSMPSPLYHPLRNISLVASILMTSAICLSSSHMSRTVTVLGDSIVRFSLRASRQSQTYLPISTVPVGTFYC